MRGELVGVALIGFALLSAAVEARRERFDWDRTSVAVFLGTTTAALLVTFDLAAGGGHERVFVAVVFALLLSGAYAGGTLGRTQ